MEAILKTKKSFFNFMLNIIENVYIIDNIQVSRS